MSDICSYPHQLYVKACMEIAVFKAFRSAQPERTCKPTEMIYSFVTYNEFGFLKI